jgi:hypothetical protein
MKRMRWIRMRWMRRMRMSGTYRLHDVGGREKEKKSMGGLRVFILWEEVLDQSTSQSFSLVLNPFRKDCLQTSPRGT